MRTTLLTVCPYVVGVMFAIPLAAPAAAQTPPAPPSECSPVIINKSCTVTITTDSPSTPRPVKLKRGATLQIVVNKRPLEKINVDKTSTDAVLPDPLAAIAAAFAPGLARIIHVDV